MMNYRRRRVCVFCKNNIEPDYRKESILKHLVSERGKIYPRRFTGTCAPHQRKLAKAIKRARIIALLPFVSQNVK